MGEHFIWTSNEKNAKEKKKKGVKISQVKKIIDYNIPDKWSKWLNNLVIYIN